MPELPEVQTIVNDLNKKVVGLKIIDLWTDWPKMIKDPFNQSKFKVSQKAVSYLKKHLPGKKILKVKRVGKNILIYLSGDHILLAHQKMTGHFLVGKWEIKKNKVIPIKPKEMIEDSFNGYIHLIFSLDNGAMLAFSDIRKFAKVLFGKTRDIENLKELKLLGPDALDSKLTNKKLKKILSFHKRKIKTVLLDPKVIAGIGNIYSDEMLWMSKIHPERSANSLTDKELKELLKNMKKVLKLALKLRGTSSGDFRDTYGKPGNYTKKRVVYRLKGKPCKRCKKPINRIVVGGRSAHFCKNCQRI